MVNQYETTIQAVRSAARTHTQKSKGTVDLQLTIARKEKPSQLSPQT